MNAKLTSFASSALVMRCSLGKSQVLCIKLFDCYLWVRLYRLNAWWRRSWCGCLLLSLGDLETGSPNLLRKPHSSQSSQQHGHDHHHGPDGQVDPYALKQLLVAVELSSAQGWAFEYVFAPYRTQSIWGCLYAFATARIKHDRFP